MTPLSSCLRDALVAATLFAAIPATAAGHPGEKHATVEECNSLPGTKKTGDRAACIHCVKRVEKHAYHYSEKPGHRCKAESDE